MYISILFGDRRAVFLGQENNSNIVRNNDRCLLNTCSAFVLWKYILKYLVAKGHDICNSDGLGKQCIYRKREKEADFYHLVNLDRRWKSFLCYSCNFSLKFEVDSKF